MTELGPFILTALVSFISLGRLSLDTYKVPKKALLVLGAFILGLVWLMNGPVFFLDSFILQILICMIAWWFLCAIQGTHASKNLEFFTFFVFGLFIWMILKPSSLELGIMILAFAGIMHSFLGIFNHLFKFDPIVWIKAPKKNSVWSFQGNPNMLGHFLVPNFFLWCYLAMNHNEMWSLGAAACLYTIFLTECRAAMVATGVGILYMLFMSNIHIAIISGVLLGLLALGILFFIFLNTYLKLGTKGAIADRLSYWKVAWAGIKTYPLFGCGFDGFSSKVAFMQVKLNAESNGEFLKKENYEGPWVCKVHNDYLQHILDNGLLGLVFILSLSSISLLNADPFLGAGLVGILASGLLFHTFHIHSVNLYFWFLVLHPLYGQDMIQMPSLGMLTIPIVLIVGFLSYKYGVKCLIDDIVIRRQVWKPSHKRLMHALKRNPRDEYTNGLAAQYYYSTGDVPRYFYHAMMALQNYKSRLRYWTLWHSLGLSCMLSGSVKLARFCHEQALMFYPEYKESQEALKQIEIIEKTQARNIPKIPSTKITDHKLAQKIMEEFKNGNAPRRNSQKNL